jgi:hypothetical protein
LLERLAVALRTQREANEGLRAQVSQWRDSLNQLVDGIEEIDVGLECELVTAVPQALYLYNRERADLVELRTQLGAAQADTERADWYIRQDRFSVSLAMCAPGGYYLHDRKDCTQGATLVWRTPPIRELKEGHQYKSWNYENAEQTWPRWQDAIDAARTRARKEPR